MPNNNQKILMTQASLDQIKKEYENLTKTRRPVILERLSEARSAGDLKENTEYSTAKDELAFIDGRIEELEAILQ
jgi:transcription elongation factor GreA